MIEVSRESKILFALTFLVKIIISSKLKPVMFTHAILYIFLKLFVCSKDDGNSPWQSFFPVRKQY